MLNKVKSSRLRKDRTIIFIRHGKPMLHSRCSLMRFIKGWQFNQYCYDYEKSTIDPAYPPPETVINIIGNACQYVSSDLRRARDSSAMLPFTNTIFDRALREAEMPPTKQTEISLPLFVWLIYSRMKWWIGLHDGNSESKPLFHARIQHMGEVLHHTARQKRSIVVMSHGITIHYLKKLLADRGWRSRQASVHHWGITCLER